MDCPNEEDKKEIKKGEQSSPSKVSGASQNSEELKQKCESLEKDLEQLKKKNKDLEKMVAEKDLRVQEMIETLVAMEAASDVFKKDFEEERKDRERAHQQLEALKSQQDTISETVARSLQAEVVRTTKERDLLQMKLEDSKTQYKKLWDENGKRTYELNCVCYDMKNLQADYDKCQQEVRYYRDQLDLLEGDISRRNTDLTVMKGQLDLATSMNDKLINRNKALEGQVEKLTEENRHLLQQLSATEHERRCVFSPDEGNLQHQATRYDYNPTREDSQLSRRPPSQRHFTRDLSPRHPDNHSRVHTSPQIRNRDSTDQKYDVSPDSEFRKNARASSDGDMQSYRQEHCDRNGLEGGRPFRAGPYTNVQPDPRFTSQRRDKNYDRPLPSRRSRDGDPHFRAYTQDEDTRYTQTLEYISLQVGELSEAEITGVKEFVEDTRDSLEEELTQDIKLMCRMMKNMRCDRQECVRTDLHRDPDPNLVCPMCKRQFRLGEIQKYRKHTQQCGL